MIKARENQTTFGLLVEEGLELLNMYAYQTHQGQTAIQNRNQTAEFYACIKGFKSVIDPDPLSQLAVSFQKNGRVAEIVVIRNRSESMDQFSWATIMVTTEKINLLAKRAKLLGVVGRMLVKMADNVLLSWTVVDSNGIELLYDTKATKSKGDCMGSFYVSRENTFFPIDEAEFFYPSDLI